MHHSTRTSGRITSPRLLHPICSRLNRALGLNQITYPKFNTPGKKKPEPEIIILDDSDDGLEVTPLVNHNTAFVEISTMPPEVSSPTQTPNLNSKTDINSKTITAPTSADFGVPFVDLSVDEELEIEEGELGDGNNKIDSDGEEIEIVAMHLVPPKMIPKPFASTLADPTPKSIRKKLKKERQKKEKEKRLRLSQNKTDEVLCLTPLISNAPETNILKAKRSITSRFEKRNSLNTKTLQDVRCKALKRLGKTRWGTPLTTNRIQLTKNTLTTTTVQGWTERKYQQAHEFSNKRARRDRYVRNRFGNLVWRAKDPIKNRIPLSTLMLSQVNLVDTTNIDVRRNQLISILQKQNPTPFSDGIERQSENSRVLASGMNMHAPSLAVNHLKGSPRPIVMDGSNIAMSHGNGRYFSCRGILLCAEHFQKLGHKTIIAFVPAYRKKSNESIDTGILFDMERSGIVKFTPSRDLPDGRRIASYDDRFVVQAALQMDAIIITNDNYRDLMEEEPSWRTVIETKLLQFIWVNEEFIMFPVDPLGRTGPSLKEFLCF